MGITVQSQQPQPTGPAKYTPSRASPGMTGQTAPIQGSEEAPRFRETGAPARVQQVDQGQREDEENGGEEGGDAPDASNAFRLGVLARQERAARAASAAATAAEARLKAFEERMNAREEALRKQEEDAAARAAEWRRNPKALLEAHGFVPEAAMQYMLNKEKLTPEQQLAVSLEDRLAQERQDRDAALQKLRDDQKAAREAEDATRQEQEQAADAEAERVAIEEIHTDLGTIIDEAAKEFPLVRKAGQRGVQAAYGRLQEISDEAFKTNGRRPPLTTKMLERAINDVEQAARKEYRELIEDEDAAAALEVRPAAPRSRVPQTLTNDLGRRVATPAPERAQRQETAAEKRERVKGLLDGILQRQRRP